MNVGSQMLEQSLRDGRISHVRMYQLSQEDFPRLKEALRNFLLEDPNVRLQYEEGLTSYNAIKAQVYGEDKLIRPTDPPELKERILPQQPDATGLEIPAILAGELWYRKILWDYFTRRVARSRSSEEQKINRLEKIRQAILDLRGDLEEPKPVRKPLDIGNTEYNRGVPYDEAVDIFLRPRRAASVRKDPFVTCALKCHAFRKISKVLSPQQLQDFVESVNQAAWAPDLESYDEYRKSYNCDARWRRHLMKVLETIPSTEPVPVSQEVEEDPLGAEIELQRSLRRAAGAEITAELLNINPEDLKDDPEQKKHRHTRRVHIPAGEPLPRDVASELKIWPNPEIEVRNFKKYFPIPSIEELQRQEAGTRQSELPTREPELPAMEDTPQVLDEGGVPEVPSLQETMEPMRLGPEEPPVIVPQEANGDAPAPSGAGGESLDSTIEPIEITVPASEASISEPSSETAREPVVETWIRSDKAETVIRVDSCLTFHGHPDGTMFVRFSDILNKEAARLADRESVLEFELPLEFRGKAALESLRKEIVPLLWSDLRRKRDRGGMRAHPGDLSVNPLGSKFSESLLRMGCRLRRIENCILNGQLFSAEAADQAVVRDCKLIGNAVLRLRGKALRVQNLKSVNAVLDLGFESVRFERFFLDQRSCLRGSLGEAEFDAMCELHGYALEADFQRSKFEYSDINRRIKGLLVLSDAMPKEFFYQVKWQAINNDKYEQIRSEMDDSLQAEGVFNLLHSPPIDLPGRRPLREPNSGELDTSACFKLAMPPGIRDSLSIYLPKSRTSRHASCYLIDTATQENLWKCPSSEILREPVHLHDVLFMVLDWFYERPETPWWEHKRYYYGKGLRRCGQG